MQLSQLEQLWSQLPLLLSFLAFIVAIATARRKSRVSEDFLRRLERLERRVAAIELSYSNHAKQYSELKKQIDILSKSIIEQKSRIDWVVKVYEMLQKKLIITTPALMADYIISLLPRERGKTIVIDGSNVARLAPNAAPTIKNILLAVYWAREQGMHPVVIMERAVFKRLDDKNVAKQLEKSGILHVVPMKADEVVLEIAEKLNAPILSNDQYTEYRNRFPRIDERRRSFMIIDGKIYVLKPGTLTSSTSQ